VLVIRLQKEFPSAFLLSYSSLCQTNRVPSLGGLQ